jgi:hypothetical protein
MPRANETRTAFWNHQTSSAWPRNDSVDSLILDYKTRPYDPNFFLGRLCNVNGERLFVERKREFTVQVGCARKARLTGCFIYASRAWLAYDYRGTNDERRRLALRIHERFCPNRRCRNQNPLHSAKGAGA